MLQRCPPHSALHTLRGPPRHTLRAVVLKTTHCVVLSTTHCVVFSATGCTSAAPERAPLNQPSSPPLKQTISAPQWAPRHSLCGPQAQCTRNRRVLNATTPYVALSAPTHSGWSTLRRPQCPTLACATRTKVLGAPHKQVNAWRRRLLRVKRFCGAAERSLSAGTASLCTSLQASHPSGGHGKTLSLRAREGSLTWHGKTITLFVPLHPCKPPCRDEASIREPDLNAKESLTSGASEPHLLSLS